MSVQLRVGVKERDYAAPAWPPAPEAVARTRPRAVVSVGEAGDADAVLVERVARNVADARIPDEDGDRPMIF